MVWYFFHHGDTNIFKLRVAFFHLYWDSFAKHRLHIYGRINPVAYIEHLKMYLCTSHCPLKNVLYYVAETDTRTYVHIHRGGW